MQTAARAMLARVSRAAVARSGAAPFCAVAEGGSKSVGKPEEAKLERIEDLNRKGKGKALTIWNHYNVEKPSITYNNAPGYAISSGWAQEFVGRTATITKPSKPAYTSGVQTTRSWTITFDNQPKWSSPLMGYLSSSDTVKPMTSSFKFDTKEQAALFCRRNGWQFVISEAVPPVQEVKSYAFNFLPEAVDKASKQAGPRRARSQYANTHSYTNPWVNLGYTKRGDEEWGRKQGGGSKWTSVKKGTPVAAAKPKQAAAAEPKKPAAAAAAEAKPKGGAKAAAGAGAAKPAANKGEAKKKAGGGKQKKQE